jgi:tetratricopeptide (TPR) repeat protein
MRLVTIMLAVAIATSPAALAAQAPPASEVSAESQDTSAPDASTAAVDAASADESADASRPPPLIAPVVELPTDPLAFMVAATSQIDAREFAAAATVLENGIGALEREGSRYDPRLAAPLILLGDAYFGQGDYARAKETYESAIHVERVNDGLHTPKQVEAVYKEADAMAALGDYEGASGRHEYAFELLERAYGPTSEQIVPGLYRLADWYVRNYNIYGARPLYQRARDNLERARGANSPDLVDPLRRLAETYRLERCPPYGLSERREEVFQVTSTGTTASSVTSGPQIVVNRFSDGERALQEVVALVEADPDATPVDRALAVLDLADWNLFFEKYERAATLYAYVDDLLRTKAGLDDAEIAQYFGTPVPICLRLPDGPRPPPVDLRQNPTEGHIELTYVVNTRGSVADLATVSSEPEGMMDLSVRKAFRAATFRPVIDHGKPVASPPQSYRHSFVYYPRATPEGTKDAAKAEDADASDAETADEAG